MVLSPSPAGPSPAPFVVDEGVRSAIQRAQAAAAAGVGWKGQRLFDQPAGRLEVKLLLETGPKPQRRRRQSSDGEASSSVGLPECEATVATLRMLAAYDGTALTISTTKGYEERFGDGRTRTAMAVVRCRGNRRGLARDGTLYLSPQLAHDLGVHHDLISEAVLGKSGDDDDDEGAVQVDVRKAKEGDLVERDDMQITVTKVAMPETRDLMDFTALDQELSYQHSDIERASFSLREFFNARRLIEAGQVLAIPSRAGPGAALNAVVGERKGDEDHFFVKVVDVKPKQDKPAVISASNSRIVLQGSTSSATPPRLELDFGLLPRLSSNETAKTLLPLLLPYFHCKLRRSPRTSIILHGPSGCNKAGCVRDVASALGVHLISLNTFDLIQSSEEKTVEVLNATFEKCKEFSPCVLLLRKGHAFSQIPHQTEKDRLLFSCLSEHMVSGNERERKFEKEAGKGFPNPRGARGNIMVIVTTESVDDFPAGLRSLFSHEVECSVSKDVGKDLGALPGVEGVEGESLETVGLNARDINAVVSKSFALSLLEGQKSPKSCLDAAMRITKDRIAKTLGAPKVPSVQWGDVGGLEEAKKAIIATIETPLKYPHLFSKGLKRRSGVLLYGPPGTGKTLLAKAIATEFKMNFLSVKGPELINMYVGESERNVREVFAKARGAAPCILFFDELDSLAPARGSGGDSGGVMDRVVSQFLAELDGIQAQGPIFIVGATNRPDLIDGALLRPGRFDVLQYINLPNQQGKECVLRALTRNMTLEGVSLDEVASQCPSRYSGADLYALCVEAWMLAARRGDFKVRREDFMTGLDKVKPSLSDQEIEMYETLKSKMLK
ncbi:AAA-type ATPase [Chloropicon primus]|uniref:Peroxisomal ATPase PEX6 n=1 Tax=Chloropicon primus TaxID=1764295 RepID=A0A5B8MJ72_9CHLO|nr:AAA-type ATPase [Chloropicon primus]UPQ98926.1 AAA-type ATPase [Chloropicon primus]|eukprot:QDZ19715.1 AAA-type ATPase [Chloropicon primus]